MRATRAPTPTSRLLGYANASCMLGVSDLGPERLVMRQFGSCFSMSAPLSLTGAYDRVR